MGLTAMRPELNDCYHSSFYTVTTVALKKKKKKNLNHTALAMCRLLLNIT